jgi:drug/metabolite transporter (DMT)-like permease
MEPPTFVGISLKKCRISLRGRHFLRWRSSSSAILTEDERLTAAKVAGVLLGLAGVIVVVGPDALAGLGSGVLSELAVLAAALCYASAGLYGRRFRRMALPPLIAATGQVTATAAMMLPIALYIDRPWLLPMPAFVIWGALLGSALLCTALGYVVYFRLLASAGASNLLLVTFLIPASAVLLGVLVLGEHPAPRHIAGMALIALGLAANDGRVFRGGRTLRPTTSSETRGTQRALRLRGGR